MTCLIIKDLRAKSIKKIVAMADTKVGKEIVVIIIVFHQY